MKMKKQNKRLTQCKILKWKNIKKNLNNENKLKAMKMITQTQI